MSSHTLNSWPQYSEEEISAVQRVLASGNVNYWTGDEGKLFEREFADYADAKYAIALANGTLALQLALEALDVGPGDDVIVTPRSFVASASCAMLVGARPLFADVDRDTQVVTAESIEAVLTPATKAVVVVHLAGMPADMDPIMSLAEQRGLYVIEDCAQAHGAQYKGRSVGSIGHVGAWSFCQDKIMTTGGEGGMVTTNDETLWSKMWSLKDHGKCYQTVNSNDHPPGFRWLHKSLGNNYRMTEMQAAMGRVQLRLMSQWRARRTELAQFYAELFQTYPWLRVPATPAYATHAHYKFYAFVVPEALPLGWTRDDIMIALNKAGVPCFHGSCSEIYREGVFREAGYGPAVALPEAQYLGETSLMFLVHPTLDENDLSFLLSSIKRVFDSVIPEAKVG
jgi:dTDP-4-amino-4,6-dideoxygalactose transaminase